MSELLVVAVPTDILAPSFGFPSWAMFRLYFAAVLPLSNFLDTATEDISSCTSGISAGLLSATFGNVVEVMVIFIAVVGNNIGGAQAALLGSMLSNILFALCHCCICDG